MTPTIETPRGKILEITTKSGKVKVRLVWNNAKFAGGGGGSWQGRYNAAQRFIDGEILRLCDKFTPFRTGMLIKSGILGTEIGSGLVQWIAPYARRQYYSKRKPGSETGPLRGPHWFERAKSIHKGQIVAGARRIAGRGS